MKLAKTKLQGDENKARVRDDNDENANANLEMHHLKKTKRTNSKFCFASCALNIK